VNMVMKGNESGGGLKKMFGSSGAEERRAAFQGLGCIELICY
jgi:hypothetical protein